MDVFGECITETLQRQHDEKTWQGDQGAGVHVPGRPHARAGGGHGKKNDAAFQDLAACPRSRTDGQQNTPDACWMELAFSPQQYPEYGPPG